jgi:hypothetical protein
MCQPPAPTFSVRASQPTTMSDAGPHVDIAVVCSANDLHIGRLAGALVIIRRKCGDA